MLQPSKRGYIHGTTLQAPSRPRLYDDARRLLDALGRRYPLALVTNGAQDAQRDKLRVADIETVFNVVVVSAEVGAAKPDPWVLRLAQSRRHATSGRYRGPFTEIGSLDDLVDLLA